MHEGERVPYHWYVRFYDASTGYLEDLGEVEASTEDEALDLAFDQWGYCRFELEVWRKEQVNNA